MPGAGICTVAEAAAKKGSRISYKETIDRIYDLDKEKLDRLLSLLDELERRGQL